METLKRIGSDLVHVAFGLGRLAWVLFGFWAVVFLFDLGGLLDKKLMDLTFGRFIAGIAGIAICVGWIWANLRRSFSWR